jgi:hypothetical protein
MEPKQIIIILLVIAFYLFKFIRKAKNKTEEGTPNTPYSPFEEYKEQPSEEYYKKGPPINSEYETYEQFDEHQLLKNQKFSSETLETTSLETDFTQPPQNRFEKQKIGENKVQVFDNEDENKIDISIEQDEIRKGFLYSEILKRKYN